MNLHALRITGSYRIVTYTERQSYFDWRFLLEDGSTDMRFACALTVPRSPIRASLWMLEGAHYTF